MSKLPDPWLVGLAKGWQVLGHSIPPPATLKADVVVIGTGAGGGVTAELLARAGLRVIMLEEGPLKTSKDFNQLESEAYPALYQESAARKTDDKAINILQGRCVGGSTTVNWTSSFRTPSATLTFWRNRFGLAGMTEEAMAPYFQEAERRLNIGAWLTSPNENNELLRKGASRLGISSDSIPRNVKGCWNLGSCGMGCPTNAKQSMLLTTVPTALDRGAVLLVNTRALRLNLAQGRIQSVMAEYLSQKVHLTHTEKTSGAVEIKCEHVVVAGGAINSPALLLRSSMPDPYQVLGRRTFLHPVVMSAAVMEHEVAGWQGAPQTIYSDHFLETQPIDGQMGYKLEVPPIHPVIFASSIPGYGEPQAALLKSFANQHILLALLRDGFHDESVGGRVGVRADGSPTLHYPLNDFVMDGARRALLSMAEIQFAAGAKQVLPVHEMAKPYTNWGEAKDAIFRLPMLPLQTRVVSAHVMGGCGMADSPQLGVTRPDGAHWQIPNLSVHDGSLFPTSIGANPQLSIYGLVNRLTQNLIRRLGGRPEALA
ncbi:MAG TPA: GMC family oxidoreductase [Burkholderiaceae bacterium]|nr:GMC family oxidoreductase [Burkholderiaceae bacterium]